MILAQIISAPASFSEPVGIALLAGINLFLLFTVIIWMVQFDD